MTNNTIEIITANVKFPSPFTHRVQILCHEKNINYELIPIDIYQKPAWFMDIAPLGQVPVMRTKDTVITDSHAICEYLDSLAAPYLLPAHPLERAKHQAEIAFADEIAREITQFVKQKKSQIRDLKALDKLLATLDSKIIGPYFGGEHLTLIDIALIPHLRWLDALEAHVLPFSLLQQYNHLSAWFHNMLARSSVRDTSGMDFNTAFIDRLRERGLLEHFE